MVIIFNKYTVGAKNVTRIRKKEALSSLQSATNRYEMQAKETQEEITALFLLRQKCSKNLIARGEIFINRLANTPKEFDKSGAS